MKEIELNWTHQNVKLTDIRKTQEFYIFTIDQISTPLMVKDKIFEERLRMYFLKEATRVTRDEILSVKWNMYISKGHYIKIFKNEIQEYQMDLDKFYVSFLEIAGPLGTMQTIIKDKENSNN